MFTLKYMLPYKYKSLLEVVCLNLADMLMIDI